MRPFEHTVLVRPTGFHSKRGPDADKRNEFISLSKELVEDEGRNRLICEDVIRAVRASRSPLVLTERNLHLDALAAHLSGVGVRHLVVLRGGMGKKERATVAERGLRIFPPTRSASCSPPVSTSAKDSMIRVSTHCL